MFKKISSFRDADFNVLLPFHNSYVSDKNALVHPASLPDKTEQHPTECAV